MAVADVGVEATVASSFDFLFSELAHSPLECDMPVKAITTLIKDAAAQFPFISEIYLRYLCYFKSPDSVPYIEILPSLFAYSSDSILNDVIDQLSLLVEESSDAIVPIISVWIDLLPISALKTSRLHQVIESALSSIDESEIPFLFSTLLKACQSPSISNILMKLLDEVWMTYDIWFQSNRH